MATDNSPNAMPGPTTPEQVLGGKQIFYTNYVYSWGAPTYSLDAVNVVPDKIEGPIPSFTLVVGPPESGKSYFAYYRLHELVFPNVDEKEILRIQIHPNPIIRYMRKNKGADCPTSVVDCVKGCLDRKLGELGPVPSVQLYLHVVFDDISWFKNDFKESLEEYLNTTEKIESIVKALQTMKPYTFEKGVHLSLVGYDVDEYTAKIDPADTIKFRMQKRYGRLWFTPVVAVYDEY